MAPKIKNGDIILSHNGTEHTADSLDRLLTNIEEKGFKVVTVSELIYHDYKLDIIAKKDISTHNTIRLYHFCMF